MRHRSDRVETTSVSPALPKFPSPLLDGGSGAGPRGGIQSARDCYRHELRVRHHHRHSNRLGDLRPSKRRDLALHPTWTPSVPSSPLTPSSPYLASWPREIPPSAASSSSGTVALPRLAVIQFAQHSQSPQCRGGRRRDWLGGSRM